MKSYTDIEQSKKLAKILPIESADFHFAANLSPKGYLEKPIWGNPEYAYYYNALPCWSLAALLDIYPMIVGRDMGTYCCWQNSKHLYTKHYDNPVDACYEMILKLHEKKLL